MKLLVLVLGILLCQAPNVSCGFLEYIYDKFNEFTETVASTFREVGEKIRHFIYHHRTHIHENNAAVQSQPLPYGVIKPRKTFTTTTKTTLHVELETEATININNALLSTPQLAALHGKKVESHVISTKDGYLLTLHRVGKDKLYGENFSDTTSGTVLLHHGLLGSSADWILLGPEKSLPYILSSVGYDVWMINARGNYYSRGHMDMKVDCPEYWDFSFHEIGEYDIPAAVDYIRKVKNRTEKIDFIGHSMGTTALLVLLSTAPKYNDYFRIAIFLAPLVFMTNSKGPIKIISALPKNDSDEYRGEFMPQRKVPCLVATEYCVGPKMYCNNPLFFFSGTPDYAAWNDSFVARLISHVPAGGSAKTIVHYEQLTATGKFHKYGNIHAEYPLSEVTLPIAMFSSSEDWLAAVPDVLKLFYTIRMPIDHYVIHGKNISHTDFVWGSKANQLIFPRILEYLGNGLNYTSTFRNEV